MTSLPIGQLAQRNVDVERPPGAPATGEPESWVARIRQTYAFTGYDVGQRDFTVSYVLNRTPDGWRFTGVADGQNDRQPFDLPGLAVVSSPDTLVIGDVPAATLRAYLALGDAAHDRIATVWGEAQPAVIVAPSTLDALKAQLGPGRGRGLRPDRRRHRRTAAARHPGAERPGLPQPRRVQGAQRHRPQRRRHPRADPRDGAGHDGAQRADLAVGGVRRRRRARARPGCRRAPSPPTCWTRSARARARPSCPTRRPSTPPRARSRRPTARRGWRCRGCGSGSARTRWSPSTARSPDRGRGSRASRRRSTSSPRRRSRACSGTTQDAFVADWLAYLKRLSR